MGDPPRTLVVSPKSAGQFRSLSLPRLGSDAPSAAASGALGSAGQQLLPESRWQRTARTVSDCLAAVKALSQRAYSAQHFRERCSSLLGASIAASLALQEALSSSRAANSDLNVQHLAADLQARLLAGDALVRKYGHEGMFERLLRFESKAAVEAKFDDLILQLQDLTNRVWELLDPDNRLKRGVVAQGPAASISVTSGNVFARQSLRSSRESHAVSALLAFADVDPEQCSEPVVAWAAHRDVVLSNLSNQLSHKLRGAGEHLACMIHDAASGCLWTGHLDGSVRIWSLEARCAAADGLRLTSVSITALAVDPDNPGLCWAGTADGEVLVVRFQQQGVLQQHASGQLEVVHVLLGFEAHSPTARSIDSGSSYASSEQPMYPASVAGSSTATATSASVHCSSAHSRRAGRGGKHCSSRHRQRQRPGQAQGQATKQLELAQQLGHRPSSSSRAPSPDDAGGLRSSLEMLESCLGGSTSASRRDTSVHSGPVKSILIAAGRAYTAGGGSSSTAQLHIWDSNNLLLLKTLSRRTSRWARWPVESMCMVHWSSAARRVSLGPAAAAAAAGSGAGTPGSSAPSAGGSAAAGVLWHTGSGVGSGPSRASSLPMAAAMASTSDRHLVTGHSNGSLVVWDPSAGDTLRPVLLVEPPDRRSRKPITSIVVLQELGVLACGHANGRVYMRRLDPRVRVTPCADDANLSRWRPPAFSLQSHRLGLRHLSGHGHMLVTSGKTGSIKLWPETTLRCLASEAGIQLPHNRNNPLAEAINSMLFADQTGDHIMAQRSMLASGLLPSGMSLVDGVRLPGSSSLPPLPPGAVPQQQQQQREALLNGLANGVEHDGSPRQQQQQSQQPDALLQQQQQPDAPQQQPDAQQGAEPPQPQPQRRPLQLSRINSNGRWSQNLRASNWFIEWSSLQAEPGRRRVIGRGSYGRVEVYKYNQTDVAVKVFTEGGSRPGSAGGSGSGGNDGQQGWDEARLSALRHEVSVLERLRHPNVVLFMGVCLSPPAVVTELCPLRSLYDVLQKARTEAAMSARLTWTRRLMMAGDAARGMLYLHTQGILHRDLKSPNLFVTQGLNLKVGDFNLSRFMTLGSSCVKSSLELNPRWSAPEVIRAGLYSPASDVYSFGIVLWELLTWQEPWEGEGTSLSGQPAGPACFQILLAVPAGQRPPLPPLDELPGQLGPPAAVQQYVQLMEACWANEPEARPSFTSIVERLRELLRASGPAAALRAPGGGATAAQPPPPPPARGVSEGALLAQAAAAELGAAAAAPHAAAPDAGAGGALHHRSHSELVGAQAAQAAAAAGPAIADLLQLGRASDELPGPSAPQPPAAALPPIPGTAPEAHGELLELQQQQQQPRRPAPSPFAVGASSPFGTEEQQQQQQQQQQQSLPQALLPPPPLPPQQQQQQPTGLLLPPPGQHPAAIQTSAAGAAGGGRLSSSGCATPPGARSPIRPSPFASSPVLAAMAGADGASSGAGGAGGCSPLGSLGGGGNSSSDVSAFGPAAGSGLGSCSEGGSGAVPAGACGGAAAGALQLGRGWLGPSDAAIDAASAVAPGERGARRRSGAEGGGSGQQRAQVLPPQPVQQQQQQQPAAVAAVNGAGGPPVFTKVESFSSWQAPVHHALASAAAAAAAAAAPGRDGGGAAAAATAGRLASSDLIALDSDPHPPGTATSTAAATAPA